MSHLLILRASRVLVLVLAGTISYLAFKSYRHGHGASMLFMSAGFSLIALGALTSGLIFEILGLDLDLAYAVESFLSAMGLTVLIYSIYGGRSEPPK